MLLGNNMHHHNVQGMASSLVEAGLVKDQKQAELVLSAYWADKVAIIWCIDDVHGIQKDCDKETGKSSLTDEQAQEILLSAFDEHDCNNGITWDSLHYWSQKVLKEAETDE